MKTRCMLCGRVIEVEVLNTDPYEDEDEMPKKKPLHVCQMCEAKLRKEADDSQKVPKPM